MPTYEYECKECKHNFEAFQAMSDPPLKECPKCGKDVKRLILGGAGVIFKGSGFYVTDKGSGTLNKTEKTEKTDKPEAKQPDTTAGATPCSGCAAAKTCPAASESKSA